MSLRKLKGGPVLLLARNKVVYTPSGRAVRVIRALEHDGGALKYELEYLDEPGEAVVLAATLLSTQPPPRKGVPSA